MFPALSPFMHNINNLDGGKYRCDIDHCLCHVHVSCNDSMYCECEIYTMSILLSISKDLNDFYHDLVLY
jgi:hypothetical protein